LYHCFGLQFIGFCPYFYNLFPSNTFFVCGWFVFLRVWGAWSDYLFEISLIFWCGLSCL
jgi:hypothetical protein